ncbi:MAG TPA: TIGR00282 family metallophosphoesterase [Candidatus Limnocylindria bacterium]|nr:TIGR00282 family metallophosphoesterase [Deltaproteobacteria bacterium]HSL98583.1 TIGR00282 family metallophosphoesterase [Candidatus Limnocylindria bacterium]
MWVLFLGDVVGKPGRRAVREYLSRIRSRRDVDLVIANGENVAGGVGVTPPVVRELFDAGVDVLTGGNHTWDKREGLPLVREEEKVLRPANYPPGVEGRGWGVYRGRSGSPYVVVSLVGRVFMGQYDCPFRWMDDMLPEMKEHAAAVIVDFHAEATSEKRAMSFYLDGRVSAVAGTHTHVQTVDAQVTPGGTGYITDAGMCGPANSVIGMDSADVLRRFLTQVPTRFEVASGEAEVAGVFFEIDPETGTCRGAEAFVMRETMMRNWEAWTRF